MECPVCKTELAEAAARCASCGTELEATATPQAADPNMELVCIEEVRESSRYTVLASLLEAEGIPVALHNQVGPMLRGISDGPFAWDPPDGAVRLMVPRAFEEAARELLAAPVPAVVGDDEDSAEE